MGEKRIDGIQRYIMTTVRISAMRVIPFQMRSGPADHTVRIIDLSVIGAGIESDRGIERGLACFEESLGGHKLGAVKWCSRVGQKYRAGIHFIRLPFEEEKYVLNRIMACSCREPISDPERIIERLFATLQQERAD